MPVIPVNFPSPAQGITIPIEAFSTRSLSGAIQPTETTLAVDTVVAGLSAIGLTKGWVIFLQISFVATFVFFAIFLVGSYAICWSKESAWNWERSKLEELSEKAKEVKSLMSSIRDFPDLEKGWDKTMGEAMGEARYKTVDQQSDTASSKTYVE
ncbi:hypothetical protein PG993_012789 [Apiospora rasikravindrae]|uniref:Uncharacterized protein n=1 Tax=Apiospora rasikravindrae TaxID=990691 RepID=A0ABR1RVT1_9PEZI